MSGRLPALRSPRTAALPRSLAHLGGVAVPAQVLREAVEADVVGLALGPRRAEGQAVAVLLHLLHLQRHTHTHREGVRLRLDTSDPRRATRTRLRREHREERLGRGRLGRLAVVGGGGCLMAAGQTHSVDRKHTT